MPTTIDSLQIEIRSNSTSAATGIRELAKSLGELKSSGTVTTAINNLTKLSTALRGFADASIASRSIGRLAGALSQLKTIGSVNNIGNSITKLGTSLNSLGAVNVDSVAPKIQQIATALQPLSGVKAGGINTMVNGLMKLGKVTESLDDATISAFAKKIEKLNTVLEPLSTKMTTIQAGLKGVNTKFKSTGTSAQEMGSKVNASSLNFATMIHSLSMVYMWVSRVAQAFSRLISQAIEWDGVSARFGRGFGSQAGETYEWIQRLNKEMGINTQVFMQYSSIYATMLTGFGVATEDATKMALGYTELTYDIWAGYNDIYKNFSDAADAVKSAIAGEVEPIRRAGFTIIESTLEQTAANHGLKISLANATEAQKSYLRYLTLVDQAHSQKLVGTYANELTTAEGLMRTFSQQLKSLAQSFGSLFLPALTKIMPYLQAFVDLLNDGARAIARMFGFEIQEVDWSGSLGGVTDSANSATGALDSATQAAKELKNATTGIDELNVISPNSGSSGSSGAAGGGGFTDLDVDSLWDESIFDSVQSTVSDIVKRMKEWLGITEPINSWADFMDTKLGRILNTVGLIAGGLLAWKLSKSFLNGIEALTAILANPKYAITLGLVVMITGITFAFGGMSDAVEDGVDGSNFANIIGGSILTTGGAALLGSKIATWLGNAFASPKIPFALARIGKNLGLATSGAVGAALGAGISGIVLGIPTMFVGIYDAIKEGLNWLNGILIPAGATAAGTGIGAIIGSLGGPIGTGIGALIGLAVGLVTDGVILIVQEWDKISAWFEELPGRISGWWNKSVVPFFTEDIPNFFSNTIPEWGNQIAYDMGYALGSATRAVVDWWNEDLVPFFTKTIPNFFTVEIPKAFKSATTAISKWWTGSVVPFFTKTVPNFFSTDLPNWFKSLPGKFEEIGNNIVEGLKKGVSTAWAKIKTTVTGWRDQFVQGFKDAFGIHSPSTVFEGLGKNCVAGLLKPFSPSVLLDKVKSVWNNAKNWWNDKKGVLKEYVPSIGSIKDKVSSAWTSARDWWNKKKSALSTYTPSIGNIKDRVSSAWTTARNWWSKSKSAMSTYTPVIGSIKDRLVSAWNTAKKWWQNNVKLSIPSLSFKVTYSNSGLNTVQKAVVKALGMSGWPKLSFAANGGIFDAGSLIWAGERGAEVVANAGGGRTGVMNVQQMQDAVYEGVYAAVVAAMRGSSGGNSTQAVNVYLDGRQITAAVEQRQRERGVSLMGSQVYSY